MKRIVVIAASIAVLVLAFALYYVNRTPDDISELSSYALSYAVEFKSERGFGNDRFDIYSFSLKQAVPDELFSPYDENGRTKYENFESMSALELCDKYANLRVSIEELMQTPDLEYLYVSSGGTEKLYLYNEGATTGYCFILTI